MLNYFLFCISNEGTDSAFKQVFTNIKTMFNYALIYLLLSQPLHNQNSFFE